MVGRGPLEQKTKYFKAVITALLCLSLSVPEAQTINLRRCDDGFSNLGRSRQQVTQPLGQQAADLEDENPITQEDIENIGRWLEEYAADAKLTTPAELVRVKPATDKFDPDLKNKTKGPITEEDIAHTSRLLEKRGLRNKLINIKHNPNEVNSVDWWLNKKPQVTPSLKHQD